MEKSYKKVKEKFDWRVIIKQTDKVYEGLMAIYHKHGEEYGSISKVNHVKFVGMLGRKR